MIALKLYFQVFSHMCWSELRSVFKVQLMIVICSSSNYSMRLYVPPLTSVAAEVAFSLCVVNSAVPIK